MTLGRLIQLYQAEHDGKTIMCHTIRRGYYGNYTNDEKVSIVNKELSDLIHKEITGGETSTICYYYIKDEEDKYGYQIEK